MADDQDPSIPSSDWVAMAPAWSRINDIRAGIDKIREATTKYLPKYEAETLSDYKRRLEATPWRPEWVDAHRNLCSKPFTKEVTLEEGAPAPIEALTEDIDGQGNSLHVFARELFKDAVALGLAGLLVDYPTMAPNLTLYDERASGARPYWCLIKADQIIDYKTVSVGGRQVTDKLRIKGCDIRPDPADEFKEIAVEWVRYFKYNNGAPTWQHWELRETDNGVNNPKKNTWVVVGEGALTLPEIPFVALFTGERMGGHYRVKPAFNDLAVMQIELYQAQSRTVEIMTYAGSPMLKGTGMRPPEPTRDADGVEQPASQLTVGPKTILFAPPAMEGVQPDWDFIEPAAANITAVGEYDVRIQEDMRRLALQPLTPKSGNMTATGAAIEGAKAHSAVEVWASLLKDALEQAFTYTCNWLGLSETVEVDVHTDFGVELTGSEQVPVLIQAANTSLISKETARAELRRRGILGPNFDEEEEQELLAGEQEALEAEEAIDPRTGEPIQPVAANPPIDINRFRNRLRGRSNG